ncbi:hypothetical protein SUBVAR_06103 [Subdoligranulum variabile DSM 15176]|uniref:Uncharacterized protein n=1 Tax=Subdoligranulum variabile DSM 15176 TaxID=411471 RepID=D1PNY9_9FIRM|nr:hypothetical protein SUBVAR_06103 [Subdoligranulum variabile DSM 15176]
MKSTPGHKTACGKNWKGKRIGLFHQKAWRQSRFFGEGRLKIYQKHLAQKMVCAYNRVRPLGHRALTKTIVKHTERSFYYGFG